MASSYRWIRKSPCMRARAPKRCTGQSVIEFKVISKIRTVASPLTPVTPTQVVL